MKAWSYQYRDRRNKKRAMRSLWNVKINAGARQNDTTYSKLIHDLGDAKIELDRKILADLAEHHPDVFAEIIKKTKASE